MRAIFVGRGAPYVRKSEKGGGTVYSAYFAFEDSREPGTIQEPIRMPSTASLDAKLSSIVPGTFLDIDAIPRMFQGKPQGFDLVGING